MKKYVYLFGKGMTDGNASMKELLGGKGANLAEMANLGLPVPAGFTITTECCVEYFKNEGKNPDGLAEQIAEALNAVEKHMGMIYGDKENPLLVSCRSGARSSMPGMMETVLNVGLSSATIPGLINRTNNERFVYDAYRRLIMMYSDVVMEKAENIEPADGQGIRKQLDAILEEYKESKGYAADTDLNVDDLKYLCDVFKKKIVEVLGKEFPDDAVAQLNGAIGAVFTPLADDSMAFLRKSSPRYTTSFHAVGSFSRVLNAWTSARCASSSGPAGAYTRTSLLTSGYDLLSTSAAWKCPGFISTKFTAARSSDMNISFPPIQVWRAVISTAP